MQVNPNIFCWAMLGIVAVTSFAPSYGGFSNSKTSSKIVPKLAELFASSTAPGALAICEAEGNCENGKKTWRYVGHDDPANGKLNRGWCSDQGRSSGDIESADAGCLEYVRSRLGILSAKFSELELTPNAETFTNAVDLWNQASPWVSDNFPQAYKKLQNITEARVESFRRNGQLDASGLFGICRTEGRYPQFPTMSEPWRKACIRQDQERRVQAIAKVLDRDVIKRRRENPFLLGMG